VAFDGDGDRLGVVDAEGKYVANKMRNRQIILNHFDETNSRTGYIHEFAAFNLAPGKYILHLNIEDKETQKHLRREQPVQVRAFPPEELQISSIVFLTDIPGAPDSLAYNLAKSYNRPDEKILLEYVISGLSPWDSLRVHYELRGWGDQELACLGDGEAGQFLEPHVHPVGLDHELLHQ
jgi:hypothetical protein